MDEKIVTVLNEMSEYLSIPQMKKLQEVILKTFAENEAVKTDISNDEFLNMFLAAKRIEGCSERTISYYQTTVQHLLSKIETSVRKVTTEEIREYLSAYQQWNHCSNVTIDNVRRNISSFFSWLEEEDYILKSPMRRIHKIRTPPYGYKKDPNDKNHLVIDEEAAQVVRLIFDLALSNIGVVKITRELNKRGIMPPSIYKASKGDLRFTKLTEARRKMFKNYDIESWNTVTVGAIIRDMVYVGDMENHKYEVKNYKT